MKIELEHTDLQKIADMVAERLRPMLQPEVPVVGRADDSIMDIPELCRYLAVKERWVRGKISQQGIPYFRLGNRIRFSRQAIDRYMKANRVH